MDRDQRERELEAILAEAPVPTRRPTVEALERRLYRVVPVLDHGLVRVVDYMGDDAAIVQAARVSYGRGTRSVTDDRGLIRYLMRHRHTTPFEMCELKLHIKLPIFVARQWIRHRMSSVNEYSARYSILDREFYLPAPEHLATQSSTNRQGRGATLTEGEAAAVLGLLRRDALQVYDTYEHLLNDAGDGAPTDADAPQLARELARMDLTLNYYTQWYWKIDLHNLLHFLSLRADAHAQYEIRAYAEIIGQIVADWTPLAWEAFSDYRVGGAQLSRAELDVLRGALAGGDVEALLAASRMSGREKTEFRTKFALGRTPSPEAR
jgi:thymidylate synthase (FAD)